MEADLQPLNHGLNSAWRLAQDRERWKQLVETATLQSGACPRWWWWWWLHVLAYYCCCCCCCLVRRPVSRMQESLARTGSHAADRLSGCPVGGRSVAPRIASRCSWAFQKPVFQCRGDRWHLLRRLLDCWINHVVIDKLQVCDSDRIWVEPEVLGSSAAAVDVAATTWCVC